MTYAINATSDVLDAHELDAVSGGFFRQFALKVLNPGKGEGGSQGGCANDPCAQFQAIMDQLVPR